MEKDFPIFQQNPKNQAANGLKTTTKSRLSSTRFISQSKLPRDRNVDYRYGIAGGYKLDAVSPVIFQIKRIMESSSNQRCHLLVK